MDKSVPIWARIILPLLILTCVCTIFVPTLIEELTSAQKLALDIVKYTTIGLVVAITLFLVIVYQWRKRKNVKK